MGETEGSVGDEEPAGAEPEEGNPSEGDGTYKDQQERKRALQQARAHRAGMSQRQSSGTQTHSEGLLPGHVHGCISDRCSGCQGMPTAVLGGPGVGEQQ